MVEDGTIGHDSHEDSERCNALYYSYSPIHFGLNRQYYCTIAISPLRSIDTMGKSDFFHRGHRYMLFGQRTRRALCPIEQRGEFPSVRMSFPSPQAQDPSPPALRHRPQPPCSRPPATPLLPSRPHLPLESPGPHGRMEIPPSVLYDIVPFGSAAQKGGSFRLVGWRFAAVWDGEVPYCGTVIFLTVG